MLASKKIIAAFAALIAVAAAQNASESSTTASVTSTTITPTATATPVVPPSNGDGSGTLLQVLASNEQTAPLLQLADSFNLTESLAFLNNTQRNYTVFVPTSASLAFIGQNQDLVSAFQDNPNLLQHILEYHIIPGVAIESSDVPENLTFVRTFLNATDAVKLGGQRQVLGIQSEDGTVKLLDASDNGVTVTTADIPAANGFIHIISDVLTVPSDLNATLDDNADQLSNFTSALQESNGTDALSDMDSITVFAPVNSAFDAASNQLNGLNDTQMADLLQYHVVKGVYYSTNLTQSTSLPTTLKGADINATVSDDGSIVLNGNTTVTKADILIKNGVVHLIDGVLMAPSKDQRTNEPDDEGAAVRHHSGLGRSVLATIGLAMVVVVLA